MYKAERTGVLKSVVRGIRVVRAVERRRQGMQLAEVSSHLGLHKTTALRLLRTLVAEGLLRHDPATGRYVTNMAAWASLAPLLQVPQLLVSSVQSVLGRLAASARATASIGLPDEIGRSGIAPMYAVPRLSVYYDPTRGPEATPLHASACGKCYLSALPEEELEAYLAPALARATKRTITSPSGMRRELARIRRQEFALNRGEAYRGNSAIAVPLREPSGAVAGGLGLTFVGDDVAGDSGAEYLPLLREAGAEIAVLLGDEWWQARVQEHGPGGVRRPSLWDMPDLLASDRGAQLVRSMSRSVRLMALLFRSPQGLSTAGLARQRGLNRAATNRLVATLLSETLLRRDMRGCYRVHPLFWIRQARTLNAALSVTDAVHDNLRELAASANATASLVFPDRDGTRTVLHDFALPDAPICWHPERLPFAPLHTTASGKCYLAAQSRLAIEDYISQGLPAFTEHTITSREMLLQELARVRQAGYALAREEAGLGSGAIAVPVTDGSGAVVGSLAVTPAIHEFTEARIRRSLPLLRRAATRLAEILVGDWQDRLLTDAPNDRDDAPGAQRPLPEQRSRSV